MPRTIDNPKIHIITTPQDSHAAATLLYIKQGNWRSNNKTLVIESALGSNEKSYWAMIPK